MMMLPQEIKPMSMPFRKITELWAWVAEDPVDGCEGVIAKEIMLDGRRMFTPLIGADRARIESYREFAMEIGKLSGKPVQLMCFSTGAIYERIEP